MSRIDSDVAPIVALLGQPGLDPGKVIAAMERVAGHLSNQLCKFVQNDELNEAVLARAAELLAGAEEPHIHDIVEILERPLEEEARVSVSSSLVHAIERLSDREFRSSRSEIEGCLNESSEKVQLAVIEGLKRRGGINEMMIVSGFVMQNRIASPVVEAAEQALRDLANQVFTIADDELFPYMGNPVDAYRIGPILDSPLYTDGARIGGLEELAESGRYTIIADFFDRENDRRRGTSSETDWVPVSDEVLARTAELLGEAGWVPELAGMLEGQWQSARLREAVEAAMLIGIEVLAADEADWELVGEHMDILRSTADNGNLSGKVQEAARTALQKLSGSKNPLAGDGVQSPKPKDLLAPPKGKDFLTERRAKLGLGPRLKR